MEIITSEVITKDQIAIKGEIVAYLGDTLEIAQRLSLAIVDDASALAATELGQKIKARINWLKERRKVVFLPLEKATEGVRLEFDIPIKLGEQMEKALFAGVKQRELTVKREAELKRLEVEAEAKRLRVEAEKKAKEAEAERLRIEKEQLAAEAKRKLEAEILEAHGRALGDDFQRTQAIEAKKEADAREAQLKEERDSRLATAVEAHAVGLPERGDQILETQGSIAPLPTPLPSAAAIAAIAAEAQRKADEAIAAEARKKAEEATAKAKAEADAEALRVKNEEAAEAQRKADEAAHLASRQVSVPVKSKSMNSNTRWKYDIANSADLKKLALAVGEGRAPVEYLGFNPDKPLLFRGLGVLNEDVTRMKDTFDWAAIGIRVWPEETGGFKAAEEAL